MGWIGRSIGEFGAQAGEGHDIALNWRERQQRMALDAARAKLEELRLPLEMQEIQARVRELTNPKPAGVISTRGGGTSGVTFSPEKGYSIQTLEAGADPAGAKKQIMDMIPGAPKEFQAALKSHADAIDEGADPLKELGEAQKILTTAGIKSTPTGTTLNRLQARADEQLRNGDVAGYQETLKEIREQSQAAKPGTPTQWNLRVAALKPGPEGDEARAVLKSAFDEQKELLKQRGMAFGQGRLFALQTVWEDGVPGFMTGFEALAARNQGRHVTLGGPIDAKTRMAYQQLNAEATPALAAVMSHIGAFDDPSDRAIFAKVLGSIGSAEYGSEASWMQNVLKQALRSGLSDQGKLLSADLMRLAETMGRFRSIAGLQATDSAMELTLGLLPGPGTPSAEFARYQLGMLQSMIQQAAAIPAMRNQGASGPPPGANIIQLDQFLQQK